MRKRLWLTAVGLLALVVSGTSCGDGEVNRVDPGPEAVATDAPVAVGPVSLTQAELALRQWAAFPVDAALRPIVLTQGRVNDPVGGFTTDDAKATYEDGWITPPALLPPAPTVDGRPLISAVDAFDVLSGPGAAERGFPALAVIAVELGSSVFETDRGSMELPAWLFRLDGVGAPAAVLALSPDTLFVPQGDDVVPVMGAHRGADDRSFVVTVYGVPGGGSCDPDYVAGVEESPTAVAVLITVDPASPPADPEVACTAVARPRQVPVTLTEPLGARVLIDGWKGAAVPIVG